MLLYCPNLAQTTERLCSLYQREATDRIFAVMKTPSRVLKQYADKYPSGFCEYPDPEERAYFWDQLLQEYTAIQDDHIPSAYLREFDQGLYGALVGGTPRFMRDATTGQISSMVAPFLPEWEEFGKLKTDPSNVWFQRYLKQIAIFRQASIGKFGISHLILVDSLNFVFELRGATATYLDLFDSPDMVRQAIDFSYHLNRWVTDTFFELVGLEQGGTCSNFGQWIPGKIISESVDPFHMTGISYFEEWGREPIERIFKDYNGGIIHLHANGRHLLDSVKSIKGLKAIRFLEDLGFPTTFELRNTLKQKVGDLPLIMDADFKFFIQALQEKDLPGGILYNVLNVPDQDVANQTMEKVRNYFKGGNHE